MKKILLSLFLISVTIALRAQNGFWEEAKGPWGGKTRVNKTSSGKLFAQKTDLSSEVYSSDDNGATWNKLKGFPKFDWSAKNVVGDAGNLYWLDEDSDTWKKSSNGGNTWTSVGGVGGAPFDRLVETESGALIGWQLLGNMIYRSTDGGQSWTLVADFPWHGGSVNEYECSLQTMPFQGGISLLTSYNTFDVYVYYSLNDGLDWEETGKVYDREFHFLSPSGALFFHDTDTDELLRMSAPGQPLVAVSTEEAPLGFTVLSSGRILMATSGGKLKASDDDGLSWQVLQTDLGLDFLQPMTPLNDGAIFATVRSTLCKSTDGGNTWQFAGIGIRTGTILKMKYFPSGSCVAATLFGLWRTDDAGVNWTLLASDQSGLYNGAFDLTPAGGIVSIHKNTLFYSANGDSNFVDISHPQSELNSNSNVFVNPLNDDIFVSEKYNFRRTADYGQSWGTFPPGSYGVSSMVFHPSGRIILTRGNKYILFSDNNGNSWVSHTTPFFAFGIPSIVVMAPNGTLIHLCSDLKHFMRSDDRGDTWVPFGLNPRPQYSPIRTAFAENGYLFVCIGGEIFLTINEGLSWQSIPCASPYDDGVCLGYFLGITPDQKLISQSNRQSCFITSNPSTQGAYIEGHVKIDADADCSTPDAQEPLHNRIVEAEGPYNYYGTTDPDGHYIFFVDTGSYQVKIQNPSGIWWDYCDDAIAVNLPAYFVTDTADFAVIPLSFCPLITVNVAIPQLRRCFNNEVYVEYCNQGTEPADSAWVDVMLDPFLSLVSSAQPHEDLGGNTIRFFVGDVPSSECGQFQLTVHLDCDSTVLGQTHCVMAHGFPDTLCTTVPNWSGANIEAMVSCQDSTLQFNLKNTGTAPSQILDFIIIEDDIVLMTGQEDYNIAEDLVLDFPANGSTWRIESEQEPGHPFSNLALAFAEGCGGFESLGYINQFTVNGIQPSWHRMCVENTGSFDPNDKQGFPLGFGSEHNIRPGQTIDYLIRFQNTGTDTAFTVVIRDTLSPFLDPLNIRPGASSHPYTWDLSGQGVIKFSFNNIMLPDSNVNEPRSHGFIQFSIAPYADVPLGSVIENSAAIYFDFNEPVITNTTWHTIEKSPFISVFQPEPKTTNLGLEVWPNPFNERTNIHVGKKTGEKLLLKVFNSTGDLVAQKSAVGPDIELNTKDLPAGFYWAEVKDSQGKLVGNGKMVKE